MKVQADRQMYLVVTYFGSDVSLHIDGTLFERDFSILVDGTEIVRQKLDADHPGKLFEKRYDIPLALKTGKEKVEVKYVIERIKITGEINGFRLENEKKMKKK